MTDLLLQACWCELATRYVPAADVRNGIGWSCSPACHEGCQPGAGRRPPGPQRGQ